MKAVADAPDAYYIVAETGLDPETRALKDGETFGVFDVFGDIGNGAGQGLYHDGTRHLSLCQLRLTGHRPFLLGSSTGAGGHVLTVHLTNPDLPGDHELLWPKAVLHVRRSSFLWDRTWFSRIGVVNHGLAPLSLSLDLSFDADFRDVFEVRGAHRPARGRVMPTRETSHGLLFEYHGLDGVTRQTVVQIEPPPIIALAQCRVELTVQPGQRRDVFVAVGCSRSPHVEPLSERFAEALAEATAAIDRVRSRLAGVRTSSDLFDEWLERSRSDIAMMVTQTPHGPYPYAGIPWFSAMFGRDGIITALSVLWADPSLARGVLLSLAATQATRADAASDAQPGKILHEARGGEMAALGEIPFAAYYGSVDATPLFVLLAGRYYHRTGDEDTIRRLWPHIEAALAWIDRDGDADGDGFVEYARATERGLQNQGWKDSHDAIFHADGELVEGPVALCEVQGYVYAAKMHAAELAGVLGHEPRAAALRAQAERLRLAFEERFWCDDLGVYALALDGAKRPCRVVSSNAAQCLMSGIVSRGRAHRLADTVMRDGVFSGWGVRTIREGAARYNPMAYHNGSIWPHDTALVALGLARYGLKHDVVRIAEGLFAAAQQFELRRLPELFCGFGRHAGEAPTRYPTACSPQAWAAASSLLVVQALLGLDIDGPNRRVTLRQPRLPAPLEWVRFTRLTVRDAELDLLCERRGEDVGSSVMRRSGEVALITEQ
ncbi:MAG TPA: amylo-alpha-1,6-glucosidase [Vicinamibacterales bacterium]|jgi:glycogen debranching enzyme|nr:amylo-alpha-1,6-glucosidase [Vicinamibacterales bacterium]